MEILHTTYYDEALLANLTHLQNYPEMLPFIGSQWQVSKHKILFIGESHYIDPKGLKEKFPERNFLNDWYNNSSEGLPDWLTNYINTRYNVDFADKRKEKGFRSPYAIYYNIKIEIQEHISEMKSVELIFPYFSFYNYFQRPAFKEGDSIIADDIDKTLAYNTLKEIIRLIKPEKIIFLSSMAKDNFFRKKNSKDEDITIFNNITITGVPHPGCAWWNKPNANCGNRSDLKGYRTGREKFIDIISGLN